MPPSAAVSKSTRSRSELGKDRGLALCVLGWGLLRGRNWGSQESQRRIQIHALGNLRISCDGCGCSGWKGQEGSGRDPEGQSDGTLELNKIWLVRDASRWCGSQLSRGMEGPGL